MLIEPPPPPPPVCSEWRSQLAAYKAVVDFNGFVQIKKKTKETDRMFAFLTFLDLLELITNAAPDAQVSKLHLPIKEVYTSVKAY